MPVRRVTIAAAASAAIERTLVIARDSPGDPSRYDPLTDEVPALEALNFGRAPGGEPDDALRGTLIDEIRAMRREELQ